MMTTDSRRVGEKKISDTRNETVIHLHSSLLHLALDVELTVLHNMIWFM